MAKKRKLLDTCVVLGETVIEQVEVLMGGLTRVYARLQTGTSWKYFFAVARVAMCWDNETGLFVSCICVMGLKRQETIDRWNEERSLGVAEAGKITCDR